MRPSPGQARLGLPSREYYLEDSAKMKAHRAAYRDYIVTIEKLAGLPGGEAAADRIIALETALSKAQWTGRRPPRHRQDLQPDDARAANQARAAVRLEAALAKAGLGSAKTVIVTEPSAVAGAGKILASTPLSTWKEWLAFRFVSDHASVLPKAIDDARFAFYSKELSGVQQQRERWKRGVAAVNGALGEGVGEIYVKSHYPAEVRAADERADRQSDATPIASASATNSWMDDATRKAALEKLAAFEPRIGHPVEVHRLFVDEGRSKGDPLGNSLRAADFQWEAAAQALPQAGRPHVVGHVSRRRSTLTTIRWRTRSPSRPRSCSRRSSIRTPTAPPITARSVRSSATRWATASTMRAASSTRRASCATGGRRRPPRRSRRKTDALVAQYNGFKPFPDSRSTAS